MSIFEVWKTNRSKNLKVRYLGWSQIKYFIIESVDLNQMVVSGHLDNGEAASYSFTSDYFEVYYPGAEFKNGLV